MDKVKFQIFISSTYEDLKDEREKVRDAILSMYHFPVGMELFGAASAKQWEIIKDTIDCSDYYVLIIGHRYGSVIPDGEDAGISYTEKEFRYALQSDIPILAFLIDDNMPVTPDKIEQNPEFKRKLDAFIAQVKNGRSVVWWKSMDDLAQKVTSSLYNEFKRVKRPGWIRNNSVKAEQTNEKTDFLQENEKLVTVVSSHQWKEFDEQSEPIKRGQLLSHDAMIMLAYASNEGEILVQNTLSGVSISTGRWEFVGNQDRREISRWEYAIEELLKYSFIKMVGRKDDIYQVTYEGYMVADVVINENDIDFETSPRIWIEKSN